MRLEDLRGRVVLLNFWATWCVPCRSEMPEFNQMQRELGSRGLSIVGASVSPLDTPDVIHSFQQDVQQRLHGGSGRGRKSATSFATGPAHRSLISWIATAVFVRRSLGHNRAKSSNRVIKPLLDEAQTTAQKANKHSWLTEGKT